MSLRNILLFASLLFFLTSCAVSIDTETPPTDAIYSVTDMQLLADGRYLLLLSSNFKRRYDYGRVSVFDTEEKKVVSSVLVDSFGGRMLLADDEKTIYVTTREKNRVHRLSLKKENGVPKVSYAFDTLNDSSIDTEKEPYAMALGGSDSLLLVSHLRNGEVSIFRRSENAPGALAAVLKMDVGVTEMVYDKSLDLYLTAHESAESLGVLKITREDDLAVSARTMRVELPLPSPGADIRDILPSEAETGTYYLSYRNTDDDGYDHPTLLKVAIGETDGAIVAAHRWTTALKGTLGEAAVVPCASDTAPTREFVYIASSSEENVTVVDGSTGLLVARIDMDCAPYQMYHRSDDPKGRVFVDCFEKSRILTIDGDCKSETLFAVQDVLND